MKNKLKALYKDFQDLFSKTEMSVLPGHLAFFFVLSIVPVISLITYMASSFNLPVNLISNFIEESFSSEVASLLTPIFTHTNITLQNLFILITAFVLASNGTNSIILASNMIFNLPNSSYFKRRIKALVMILILILLFAFILIFPIFGNTIIHLLSNLKINVIYLNIIRDIHTILTWPITIFMVFFFIKLTYTIAPDDKIPSKYVNRGALFTTGLWIIITSIYSYYVNNIVHYNLYYGALANIVVLMLWFYLMALIFVIGLVLNYRDIEQGIEKTNAVKLEEIKTKINDSMKK